MCTRQLQREQRHLVEGPTAGEEPAGLGTARFVARCAGDAREVLDRARNVLTEVSRAALGPWPSDSAWQEMLPDWFVGECSTEETRERAEEWLSWWRGLPAEKQAKVEREERWTLAGWLYWLRPENRTWFWWDAAVEDSEAVLIVVEVNHWPSPWGSLRWLFRAAGAHDVDAED